MIAALLSIVLAATPGHSGEVAYRFDCPGDLSTAGGIRIMTWRYDTNGPWVESARIPRVLDGDCDTPPCRGATVRLIGVDWDLPVTRYVDFYPGERIWLNFESYPDVATCADPTPPPAYYGVLVTGWPCVVEYPRPVSIGRRAWFDSAVGRCNAACPNAIGSATCGCRVGVVGGPWLCN